MFASTKMTKPISQAMTPAERDVVANPRRPTHSMNPFVPPEYCVKVSNAPISAVNRIMSVWPRSSNTPTSASTADTRPAIGFQPSMIVQPSQMPRKSET